MTPQTPPAPDPAPIAAGGEAHKPSAPADTDAADAKPQPANDPGAAASLIVQAIPLPTVLPTQPAPSRPSDAATAPTPNPAGPAPATAAAAASPGQLPSAPPQTPPGPAAAPQLLQPLSADAPPARPKPDDPARHDGAPQDSSAKAAAPTSAAPALDPSASTAPGPTSPAPALPRADAAPPPLARDTAGPAAQAAGAVAVLARSTETAHQLTLRLDPVELGHLQISIDRPKDGPASVALTVERPETLLLLLRDQTQLHRALDQAGVPQDGRSVSFHLAAQPTPPQDPTGGGAQGGYTPPNPQFGQQPGGQNPHQQPRHLAQPGAPAWRGAASPLEPGLAPPLTGSWQRAGVDITA